MIGPGREVDCVPSRLDCFKERRGFLLRLHDLFDSFGHIIGVSLQLNLCVLEVDNSLHCIIVLLSVVLRARSDNVANIKILKVYKLGLIGGVGPQLN